MIKVAVSDGEPMQLNNLERYMRPYVDNGKIKISSFSDAAQLIEECKKGNHYDIVILDIIDVKGLEAAKMIKETNRKTILIFMSDKVDLIHEDDDVHAFRYLVKPLARGPFENAFTHALHEARLRLERYYIVNTVENVIVKLDIDEILYLECLGNDILIHLNSKKIVYTANFSTVDKKLSLFGFIRIHKSYIVNIRHVLQVSRNSVTINDDIKLPLSRKRQKLVLDEFTRFLANSSL